MGLRVLSYNIHKGICFYSRQYILSELREAIRSLDTDLVFLQEVMGERNKSNGDSMGRQLEYLADSIWTYAAYGKNAVHTKGHHGNAILSKFPIISYQNIDISTNRLERRGLLHAIVQTPEHQRLHLFCSHLNLLENGRRLQVTNIMHRISSAVRAGEPIVFGGDFNDWREMISDRLALDLGLQEAGQAILGGHAKTFPSLLPMLCLDRIYFKNLHATTFSVVDGEPWNKFSDHLGILAEFRAT